MCGEMVLGIGLVIKRSLVRVSAIPLSSNDSGQVVQTHVLNGIAQW